MNSSRYYQRSLSTRNEEQYQNTYLGKQAQHKYLSYKEKKTRLNLSRIDGFENLILPCTTPKQVKNYGYLSKYPKPLNTQEEAPFNSVIQGYFLPTPRKLSFQVNKIITEPTQFNMSPIRKRQPEKYIINKNFIDDEVDIDKQLNIPQKIRLHFSCQKLQRRFLKLQELLQFISLKSINNFFIKQHAGIIDYIAEFDISYKQFILTEYLLIVLYFFMKNNLIRKNELNKLEKLITYQHQQNVCNVVYNLQINVHGYMKYMHLFYQQQQANPQIPKKIDQLNIFVDKTIDDSIKNLINFQLQLVIREYLYMKIEQKTSEFIEKLKKILESATNFLYFLPKNDNDYTLILDLEETIIHKQNNEIKIRPFFKQFLDEISRYYEIVLFSHLTSQEMDQIIDEIDQDKLIKYKLNKNHLMKYEKVFIKDLSLLGRPLNKLIVIDNDPFNFILSPQNGIQVRSWCGDQNDYALNDLMSFLGDLRLYKDVRIGLKQVKTYSQYFYVPQ